MKFYPVICVALACLLALTAAPATALALEVGERAPLFTGVSTQGPVNSADYLGRKHIVLALYFAIFTPV